MDTALTILFFVGFAAGAYLTLLGMGLKLAPRKWRGDEKVAWIGRVIAFLSLILLPTLFGASLSQVRDWLEDIWTTGGGKGTG